MEGDYGMAVGDPGDSITVSDGGGVPDVGRSVPVLLDPDEFLPCRLIGGGPQFSPQGDRVAYVTTESGTAGTDRHTLWIASLSGGGSADRVAVFDGRMARGVAWSPDGRSVAVSTVAQRSVSAGIYLVDVADGATRLFDTGTQHSVLMAAHPFSPDSTEMVYGLAERDPAQMDTVLRNETTGTERMAIGFPGTSLVPVSISPDSRWLLVMVVRTKRDQTCAVVGLTAGPLIVREVTQAGAVSSPGPWLPDSSGFYLVSNVTAEFRYLARCDLDSGIQKVAESDWDITSCVAAADTLVWSENVDGVDVLRVRRHGVNVPVAGVPRGTITHLAISPDGRQVAFRVATATRPTEIALLDLDTGRSTYLTDNQPVRRSAPARVQPRVVRYPSQQRQVPAFLFEPRPTCISGRCPAVIWVHGGPETQERGDYKYGYLQYLVAHGIAVLAPNIRGSMGYGKSWQTAVVRDWGGPDLADLAHAVHYLRSLPGVDDRRIGVAGISYGGFAVLSCLTRRADLAWRAGVAGSPVTDLYTQAVSSPQLWTIGMDSWIGDPVADEAQLRDRSPRAHVADLTAPVLILHGAKDPVVRPDQTDRFVREARAAGADVVDIRPPTWAHAPRGLDGYRQWFRMSTEFLIDKLCGEGD
jgi:dipeptidyl aminopeptidase/acylaminoacyl peptidase